MSSRSLCNLSRVTSAGTAKPPRWGSFNQSTAKVNVVSMRLTMDNAVWRVHRVRPSTHRGHLRFLSFILWISFRACVRVPSICRRSSICTYKIQKSCISRADVEFVLRSVSMATCLILRGDGHADAHVHYMNGSLHTYGVPHGGINTPSCRLW